MARRMVKLVLMLYAFFGITNVALAGGLLPSGFDFSFFTEALNTLALAPFALAGCIVDQLGNLG